MESEKKKKQDPLNLEIDMRPGIELMKGTAKKIGELVPTPENRAKAAQKRHDALKRKLEALQMEKNLFKKIQMLEKQIRRLKGGGSDGEESAKNDEGNNAETNPQSQDTARA